ncbi:MAG: QueT transporter family protein [Candidatus Methanomethylicia archaeon]
MENIKSKNLAITAIIATLYSVLVYVFSPISFQMVQIRVANALMGLIPILGVPAIIGVVLGVFIANLVSPLGFIDLLSVAPTFIGLTIIYKLRNYSVLLGLAIYSIILGAWVSFMLWYVFKIPYVECFIYVTVGIAMATVGLGYPVYKTFKRILGGCKL